MLLTSVVLILQETLEAALLISILAVITRLSGHRLWWAPIGMMAGLVMALVYASNISEISEWFDYTGQERTNALLQFSIAASIIALAALPFQPSRTRWFTMLCVLTVSLAITREGSEIALYLGGFLGQPDRVQPVLSGSAIGFGIGVSIGFLVYYGLLALGEPTSRRITLVLLALFCGNMLSQAALQLIQADVLHGGTALWDTTSLLSEDSLVGRLLYVFIGYESTPASGQVIAYAVGAAAVLGLAWLRRKAE
jgi:high-affinity iron transporter